MAKYKSNNIELEKILVNLKQYVVNLTINFKDSESGIVRKHKTLTKDIERTSNPGYRRPFNLYMMFSCVISEVLKSARSFENDMFSLLSFITYADEFVMTFSFVMERKSARIILLKSGITI